MRSVLSSTLLLYACLVAAAPALAAQAPGTRATALPPSPTGADIYRAACITCHGADGTGSPKTVVGFDAELPDFTDCAFASAEADLDWYSVVHEGSPIRALGHHMPAFGDALSSEEIELAVSHVRTFCQDPSWPRGDLNLPRALFTEKAFPENEVVWSTSVAGGDERAIGNTLLYERRIGSRTQIEVAIPIDFQRAATREWARGIGDAAFALKRVLSANMATGHIVSAGAELIVPTGNESNGLGSGHAIFEPFVMWGQILPRNAFIQMHAGVELPFESSATRETFVRTAVGTSFFGDRGFGRAWSPTVEVLWATPQGEASEWDLVPQLQVSLSKLQHVMVAGGVRIPLSDRETRRSQVVGYLLWDWYDGSFFDFWK